MRNKKLIFSLVAVAALGIVGCGTSMNAMEQTDARNEEVEIETKAKKPAFETEGDTTTLKLKGMQEINVIELSEEGSNARAFRVEAKMQGKWETIYTNDLIEAYHMAVLEEPVRTNELRLIIEDTEGAVAITDMSARYLGPITREENFSNTSYVSSTYFEHDWDYIHPDNFKSLTDIIMIGNFSFNNKGEFVLIEHGPTGEGETTHLWNSEYATTTFPKWKEKITNYTDCDVWVSITCFKGQPDGAPGGASDAFHDPAARKAFLDDLVEFAKIYDIAGYDIDWEYPATGSQWADYNNLILEASTLFKENGLQLSSAQSRGTGLSKESLNALDRINIMAYDNYGTTNNHSTFYNSAVKIINEFKGKGIDPQKLVLGMPYYGVKVDSYFEQWDYKHIYNLMQEAGEFDPGKNLYAGWGFNGPNLIRDKVVYALEQEIGGVFIWQMKNDIGEFESDGSLAGTTSRTIDAFIED
ncbi:MAG: glycoside hydrolase family 18 protein [Cellulosilyticaceae bacterium]